MSTLADLHDVAGKEELYSECSSGIDVRSVSFTADWSGSGGQYSAWGAAVPEQWVSRLVALEDVTGGELDRERGLVSELRGDS